MSESNEKDTRREFLKGAGTAAGAAAIGMLLGAAGSAEAHEVNINAMGGTPEQMEAFMALPSGPVCMVNLLKFKEGAARANYGQYGVEVQKIFKTIGAEIIFSGECKGTLIGGATWDSVAIARYPDKMALINMIQSPEYQAIHHHRESGLAGQINLAVFENVRPAAADQPVTADQLMSRMDANSDGKIDMDEAPEEMQASFGLIDTNGDGGIDAKEAQTIADFINNR